MISVQVRNTGEVRRLAKRLGRLRRKALPFALRRAYIDLAKMLREEDVKQWRVDSKSRRRSFPGAVLKYPRKVFVNPRTLKPQAPVAVKNVGADDVLRRAIHGGVLQAHGRRMKVRTEKARRGRPSARDYEAGGYIFRRRGKGRSEYRAVLVERADYAPRWRIKLAEARVQRRAPAIVTRALRREIARALDRR